MHSYIRVNIYKYHTLITSFFASSVLRIINVIIQLNIICLQRHRPQFTYWVLWLEFLSLFVSVSWYTQSSGRCIIVNEKVLYFIKMISDNIKNYMIFPPTFIDFDTLMLRFRFRKKVQLTKLGMYLGKERPTL